MFHQIIFFIKSFILLHIAKIQKFEFVEAVSQRYLSDVYHLRWKIYGEEGYIDQAQYPDQKMTDDYDAYSTNFLARQNNMPIATARLIKDSSYGFPTENLFNINRVEN